MARSIDAEVGVETALSSPSSGMPQMWLAGGGIQPGIVVGATDEFGYNVVDNPVHVHDLNATILHCLGIDHKRLTYRSQGRDFRLTDVGGSVVRQLVG